MTIPPPSGIPLDVRVGQVWTWREGRMLRNVQGLFLRTLKATASETKRAHLLVASPLRE